VSTKTRIVRWIPRVTVTLALIAAMGLVYYARQWLAGDTVQTKKLIQQISLIAPPPPPPPKVEEPPPPAPEEKVDLPKPEPVPEDLPDQPDDMSPSDQLGLDAEGGAGGDAFGLVGNRGGHALLGGGSTELWYKRMLGQELKALVNDNEELRKRRFAGLRLNIWIEDGCIRRVKLLSTSGDKVWDRRLEAALLNERLQTPPPEGIGQPVRLEISSQS
jgi:hypothetical protein